MSAYTTPKARKEEPEEESEPAAEPSTSAAPSAPPPVGPRPLDSTELECVP